MKRIIMLLALIAGIMVVPSPAQAHHPWHHWGHGYAPRVTANCAETLNGTSVCHYTSDAERGVWTHFGFRNGFVGGNPWYGCNLKSGYITVCTKPSSQIQSFCPTTNPVGCARKKLVYNPNPHLDAVIIYLCNNCPNIDRDKLVRHEYGHAIGLWERTDTVNTVMYPNITTSRSSWPDAHDEWQLNQAYNGHWEG